MSNRKQHPSPGNVKQGQTWYWVYFDFTRGCPVFTEVVIVSHKTPDRSLGEVQPTTPKRLLCWADVPRYRAEFWRSRRKALTAYKRLQAEYEARGQDT